MLAFVVQPNAHPRPDGSDDTGHCSGETLYIRAICAPVFRPEMTASACYRADFPDNRQLGKARGSNSVPRRFCAGCYAAELDRNKLLPLNIDPAIAAFRHQGAETALLSLYGHLQPGEFLCTTMPSVADIFLLGDIAFAEVCGFGTMA